MKINKYKIYLFDGDVQDWTYMKYASSIVNGKVDWHWIDRYYYDTLSSNQNPYYAVRDKLCRTLYRTRKVYLPSITEWIQLRGKK